MDMKELVAAIFSKHLATGIFLNPPASDETIKKFEKAAGFALPEDFKAFYKICNGFQCEEDLFNMIPLDEVLDREDHHGRNWFYFAEYMIFSDMWGIRLHDDGKSYIYNTWPELVLTTSLEEFLGRFLKGNVFDKDGLYDWHQSIQDSR